MIDMLSNNVIQFGQASTVPITKGLINASIELVGQKKLKKANRININRRV